MAAGDTACRLRKIWSFRTGGLVIANTLSCVSHRFIDRDTHSAQALLTNVRRSPICDSLVPHTIQRIENVQDQTSCFCSIWHPSRPIDASWQPTRRDGSTSRWKTDAWPRVPSQTLCLCVSVAMCLMVKAEPVANCVFARMSGTPIG